MQDANGIAMHLISPARCLSETVESSHPKQELFTNLFSRCSRLVLKWIVEPSSTDGYQLSFNSLKPGLHWDDVQLLCHRTLVKGFQRLGIFKSPNSPGSGSWNAEDAILASGVSSAFFPHGVGHSLGMDVHDVPSVSKPKLNDTIKSDVELVHQVSL